MDRPIRIGNASGFYGDRRSAVHEMLTGGPLDVLTGDYLSELTMMILGRDRMKDPRRGYAKTFLPQLEAGLGLALERGVKIVANAGGLNPAGLADALRELADRLGLALRVGYVTGDDLLDRADELGLGAPMTANAYLGGWGVAACLRAGADVVVTGRITDASLVVGPAAAAFGWARDDFDALAGAVVAGHVIECGAQATGGNYPFFTELRMGRLGFPIAEVHADGSSVITKHPDTGGAVTVGTVTAQLLYETAGAYYPGPDVTARLDTVEPTQEGPDRVRLSGTTGRPPPPQVKVCLNYPAGFRNQVTFLLTGLDIEAKAALVRAQLEEALAARTPGELVWTLARTDRPDAPEQEQASAVLRVTARDQDPAVVGRGFGAAAVELALASYPGFTMTAPPGDPSPYAVYRPGYVDAAVVPHLAVLPDGTRVPVEPTPGHGPSGHGPPAHDPGPLPATGAGPTMPEAEWGPTRRVPLGLVAGARSGDKGGTANVGVWTRTAAAWRWLDATLTEAQFRRLLPEAAGLPVRRHAFPNLRALNFVVDGMLGEGAAAGTRFDPQGKGIGEWLRSRHVDVPELLL
jgi:hypothetical protein